MTTTHDLHDTADFVTVEHSDRLNRYDVRIYEQDGAERILVGGLTMEEAERVRERLTRTLRTWDGWE